MKAITIGLDIAKSVFQVHVEDAAGKIVLQKCLRRSQVAALVSVGECVWLGVGCPPASDSRRGAARQRC